MSDKKYTFYSSTYISPVFDFQFGPGPIEVKFTFTYSSVWDREFCKQIKCDYINSKDEVWDGRFDCPKRAKCGKYKVYEDLKNL